MKQSNQKLIKAELQINNLNCFKESQMDLLSGFEISLEAKEEEIHCLKTNQVELRKDIDLLQEKLKIALN